MRSERFKDYSFLGKPYKGHDYINNLVVILAAIAIGFPFAYMVLTSFKNAGEVHTIPMIWIPASFKLDNFIAAWQIVPFGQFTINSVIYTVCLTIGEFLMGLTAGYAFGRMHFPKRDLIFFFVLLTYMIPSQITLIPRFMILKDLQWINTYQGLIVPELSSCFATFLLREHFRSLPDELFDAAKIDGAGYVRQMFQVALPLSKPISITLLLLAFVGHWNEYLWPLIVTNTKDMRVLPIGIQSLKYANAEGLPEWHMVMAGATMTVIPLVVLFLIGQKYFIEGAVQGAVKG
jgi:ABC-type glycerol-3-phosphate transport system permease component